MFEAMKLLKKSGVFLLLSLFISCSDSMNEKVVKNYLSTSHAVTLYSPVSTNKKLQGCDDEYLGKKEGFWKDSDPDYYYKAYNYKVDRIENFKIKDDQASCVVYLCPDNLTKAGKIMYDVEKENPYKAALRKGLDCDVIFKKAKGKWVLVHFKSKTFQRCFWLEKYQEESCYMDLYQWDHHD